MEQITNMYSQNCVICLKVGDKYSAEYVNNLYHAVRKQCDDDFYCFTDDPVGIDLGVICLDVKPRQCENWWAAWHKIEIFGRKEIRNYNRKMFLDLDIVIQGSIKQLLESDADWSVISCTWKGMKYRMKHIDQPRHNSSCIIWKDNVWVYDLWESDWENIVKNNAGIDVWVHRTKELNPTTHPRIFYSYREGYNPEHYWENDYKPSYTYRPEFSVCLFHQKPDIHELDHDNILYKIWNDSL